MPSVSSKPVPDQPADNALYLRKWAEDIRAHSGKSVDADRLEDIADEIERLRSMFDDVADRYESLLLQTGAGADMELQPPQTKD